MSQDIAKIFVVSLLISATIKYLLPIVIYVDTLAVVAIDRVAIGILTFIPLIFFTVLCSKHPPQ